MHTPLRSLGLAVAVTASLPSRLASQSLLDRTPNLSGGWVGERGTLQFNFVHRFTVSAAPTRKVSNSPTFLLSYRLAAPLVIGVNYSTNSDVAPALPNEWEAFARYARFGGALQVGYNEAARSVDAELSAARTLGPVRLLAVGRYFSNGYGSDTARFAVGGGAVLRAHRWVSVALDYVTLLDQRGFETVVWGAGLHLAIPYSPHSLSLQVTNTSTATLQGSSRGHDKFRGGFEFTIPFTLSRYFGRRKTAEGGDGAAAGATSVEMRAMAFAPTRIEVTAGTTVAWTNQDQLAHTITADDGSWDSGPIAAGATWRHTFTTAGTYAFHCTPHPFMTGIVVVK
ncbi:MAG TPA: cupredoxin family copper-binding protein [Gemmatimonadales bacterium]|jgi:plastocyanin|nr:cupredoxin family copper-binding protein [Gemmatimonadales bacterium]